MSHRILNVNVSLQSINQPQFCQQMLETMTRDDSDSLLIVTSTQRISVSSKLLQFFSPLYRDILRDIPSKDYELATLIIPDSEAVHVKHLISLLTTGQIDQKETGQNVFDSLGSSGDIVSLADSFNIHLRDTDLSGPAKGKGNKSARLRVRKLKEISSPIPTQSESLNGHIINIANDDDFHDENVIEKDSNNQQSKCSICQKVIGKSILKDHERRCSSLRKKRKEHSPPSQFTCQSCEVTFKKQMDLINHFQMKHSKNAPLFQCSICSLRFHKQNQLKKHIPESHDKYWTPGNLFCNFSEEPPSCFYNTD